MVKRITREQIEASLSQLEGIDADSANAIRAYSDYRALIKEDPLDMRDTLLAIEERMKNGASQAHELAMFFERLGRGDNDGNS